MATNSICRFVPIGECSALPPRSRLPLAWWQGLRPGSMRGRGNVNPALKQVRGGRHRGLGRALVVAQLAISMALLVGASLFIRTLVKLIGR